MTKKQSGFTIVELLIVIVVIGILAAIVIVAYNGITNRAYDNAVQSNLSNLAKQMEQYKIVSPGVNYPTNSAEYYTLGVKVNKSAYDTTNLINNAVVCFTTGGTGYAIIATTKAGNTYYVASNVSQPTSTTQTLSNGASAACGGIGVGAATWSWMFLSGSWNANVTGT